MNSKAIQIPEPLSFHFPSQVFLEWQITEKIASVLSGQCLRVVIVCQKSEVIDGKLENDFLENLQNHLEKKEIKTILYDDLSLIPNEEDLNSLSYFLKKSHADLVIGYGGRNTLIATRTAALLRSNQIFANELKTKQLELSPPLPFVSIPLGPLMGEECAPYWGVYEAETKNMFYGREAKLFPLYTFIDYSHLSFLSTTEVARLSLAILSISIDAINSKKSNEMITLWAIEAVNLIVQNLTAFLRDSQNKLAQRNICLASLYAVMAYSNTGLGLCYAIASVMNLKCRCDFFMMVSTILPHIMEYNLTTRAEEYVKISRAIGEDISEFTVIEAAIHTIETIRKLYLDLKAPKRLSEFNISEKQVLEEVTHILEMEFSKNNVREIDREGLERLLRVAY